MRRALSLLDHALGAAFRRGGRNLAIATGLALVVALAESVTLLTTALRAEYERGADAVPDLVVQSIVGGRPGLLPADAFAALAARPGVRSVRPRVWGYLYLPSVEANVTVVSTASDATADARLLAGRLPRARHELALGRQLADALGMRVGDTAALPGSSGFVSHRVVGIFRASTAMRTADLALVTEDDARALLGMPEGQVTDVAIRLVSEDESAPVAREIREAMPGARVLERMLVMRTYALTLGSRSGLVYAMLLPAIAALLLLAWDRLTGLGEDERREIAVLKLVGWSTRDVLVVRMWESGLVALVGTGVGFVLAYVYVFVLGAPLLRDALMGWSRLVPSLALTPTVGVFDLVSLLGSIVVPFVLVSVVPAFLAAMRDPVEGWRSGS